MEEQSALAPPPQRRGRCWSAVFLLLAGAPTDSGAKTESASSESASVFFKATQDYILVRPVERKQSDILEVISSEKYTQGVVISVGPGKKNRKGVINPLTVKPGDFITYGDLNRGYDFYPKYEESGVTYRILQEADIAFIADPDAPEHALPDAHIAGLVEKSRVLEIA